VILIAINIIKNTAAYFLAKWVHKRYFKVPTLSLSVFCQLFVCFLLSAGECVSSPASPPSSFCVRCGSARRSVTSGRSHVGSAWRRSLRREQVRIGLAALRARTAAWRVFPRHGHVWPGRVLQSGLLRRTARRPRLPTRPPSPRQARALRRRRAWMRPRPCCSRPRVVTGACRRA
jgi:hypothetical protein